MIATVGIVKEEVAAAPVVEGEEPAEPEVIGKGKKEDEEGEESEKGKKVVDIADCQLPIADLHLSQQLDAIEHALNRQLAIGNRQYLIVGLETRVKSTSGRATTSGSC